MHRLSLLYAFPFVRSTDLASSRQSPANFGFSPPLKTIISSDGRIAWQAPLSGSRAIPVLSKGNHSTLGIGALRARTDANAFRKPKSELIPDDLPIGTGITSAPAPPSPIP
jgi:hypothetical protein